MSKLKTWQFLLILFLLIPMVLSVILKIVYKKEIVKSLQNTPEIKLPKRKNYND